MAVKDKTVPEVDSSEKEDIPDLTTDDVITDETKIFVKIVTMKGKQYNVKFKNLSYSDWASIGNIANMGLYYKQLIFLSSVAPKWDTLDELMDEKWDRDFIRSYGMEIDKQFKTHHFL